MNNNLGIFTLNRSSILGCHVNVRLAINTVHSAATTPFGCPFNFILRAWSFDGDNVQFASHSAPLLGLVYSLPYIPPASTVLLDRYGSPFATSEKSIQLLWWWCLRRPNHGLLWSNNRQQQRIRHIWLGVTRQEGFTQFFFLIQMTNKKHGPRSLSQFPGRLFNKLFSSRWMFRFRLGDIDRAFGVTRKYVFPGEPEIDILIIWQSNNVPPIC